MLQNSGGDQTPVLLPPQKREARQEAHCPGAEKGGRTTQNRGKPGTRENHRNHQGRPRPGLWLPGHEPGAATKRLLHQPQEGLSADERKPLAERTLQKTGKDLCESTGGCSPRGLWR